MIHASNLIKNFKDYLVLSHVGLDDITSAKGIYMLEKDLKIDEHYIYVSDKNTAIELLSTKISRFQLFVSSSDWPSDIEIPKQCNLVVINRPMSSIYNSLFESITRWNIINENLRSIPAKKEHVQRLLDTAIKSMDFKGYLYILSPTFQVQTVASSAEGIDIIPTQRMERGEYLTHNQIQECISNINTPLPVDGNIQHNRIIYRTYPIESSMLLGYFVAYGIPADSSYRDLLRLVANVLPEFIEKKDPQASADQDKLAGIMEDVFISPNIDIDRLRTRLSESPDPLQTYIRSIVISFDSDKTSAQQFITELCKIFKTKNATLYDRRIVIWVSGENHVFSLDFDEKKFESLLEKHNAYAIISNAGRFLKGLRTLYLQCVYMLPILPKLSFAIGSKHFVYFEEIADYNMIRMNYLALEKNYGHNKLVYSAGPRIMEIIRYDHSHKSDLLVFLFKYLLTSGNIGKTAELLHMHRNTVVYRLKKIEELIETDLDDAATAQELLMSCKIMLYAKYVLQQEYAVENEKKEPKQ